MKKLLTFILAVVMIMGVVPVTEVHAANSDRLLQYSKNYTANERTDEYALAYFSFSPYEDYAEKYPEHNKAMLEATKGLTNDFDKATAIAKWVNDNMTYDGTHDADGSLAAEGVPKWLIGVCAEYATNAEIMFKLSGIPAKKISGYMSGRPHAWNHVFVDGRWYFADATNWHSITDSLRVADGRYTSKAYYMTSGPQVNWDGTLSIVDPTSYDTTTIGPLPLYTTISEIPELATATLYTDAACTEQVDPKTWRFDAMNRTLYTKSHTIGFNIQLDNQYKSLVSHVVDETDGYLNSFVTVPDGADFPQVKLPTKPGYTFIGWQEHLNTNGPLWNAGSGKVTKDMELVAVFKKGNISYTVKFNSNGGTTVKNATAPANTYLKQPTAPTKANYKFTGWYKDAKLTQPWNFKAIPVTSNITLYAGWESTNNAKPTSSKVLVNGKVVEFDAYNINNNNYFKLRDLAQAVNKTDKNFEVTWDGKNNAINLISNKPYTAVGGELVKGDGKAKTATLSTAKIYKDGKEVTLTAYTINGNNYFKLRDIAKAFDIGVTWDGTTNTVGIDTSISYVEE